MRPRPARGARHAAQGGQRAPVKTYYGEFKDAYYSEIKHDGTTVGLDMFLQFTPNTEVDATKIALSQSVKSYVEGNAISIDATKDRQQVKSGAGKGYYIDQLSENRNPLYATGYHYRIKDFAAYYLGRIRRLP